MKTQDHIVPERLSSVDFLGIGGIGMSALARYFREKGAQVSGYDRTPSALTRALEEEGIVIRYRDETGGLSPDLVIYTPALPASGPQFGDYRARGIPLKKRSEILGLLTRDLFSVTVGGTHGKTTVSALIAHILRETGYGCNAFLGGISLNYDTNFWSDPGSTAVIEADEYDRSFLALSPDIAVVTAMDPDHLDIYGTEAAMQDAYVAYTRKLSPEGKLVYRYGLPRVSEMGGTEKISYSLAAPEADWHASEVDTTDGVYRFTISGPGWTLENVTLHIGGLHNVENAVAGTAVAREMGIPPDGIRRALASFRGIRRRFEYVVRDDRHVYIDDYAHHPAELRTLISSARQLFPGKPCTVIFQPHLFSRTRDFADGFAAALDLADEVILLPVYPAREAPMPGIDSGLIAARMHTTVRLLAPEEALKTVAAHPPPLLITAGAGDIDRLVSPLGALLRAGENAAKTPEP